MAFAAVVVLLACALLVGCSHSVVVDSTAPAHGLEPGLAWATFIRDDCEWSAPETDTTQAVCFGNRGPGFRVRAIRREGTRWYIWDPTTANFAYVDRGALSLPAELTTDEPAAVDPAKTVVICLDRSGAYRYMDQARSALAIWIERSAAPGDVYYVRWVEENSYRPEAEAMSAVRLPPGSLVAEPTAPAPNPFDLTQVARATATARTTQATLDARTHKLEQSLDAFVHLSAPPAASADVDGCVRKAAELLAAATDDRYLVVATSDAVLPTTGVKLDRAQIRLVYLQCDQAATCDQTRAAWSALAASANAANIRFSDPSQGLGTLG